MHLTRHRRLWLLPVIATALLLLSEHGGQTKASLSFLSARPDALVAAGSGAARDASSVRVQAMLPGDGGALRGSTLYVQRVETVVMQDAALLRSVSAAPAEAPVVRLTGREKSMLLAANKITTVIGRGKEGQVLTIHNGKPVWRDAALIRTNARENAGGQNSGTGRKPYDERLQGSGEDGPVERRYGGGGGGGGSTTTTNVTNVTAGLTEAQASALYVNATGDVMTGPLTVYDTISGASLVASSTFEGAGLADCDAASSKLVWDATTKTFSCSLDQTVGTGLDQNSGDARYVRKAGDTMTGALVINLTSGIVGLEVVQMISGSTIFANASLRSSGSLAVEGGVTFASLASCTALETDGFGNIVCGTDDAGLTGTMVNTGALAATFDGRYVNIGGDTMTGALTISVQGGNINTVGFEMFGTLSGSILHANTSLRSSGSLAVEGSAVIGSTLNVLGTASGQNLFASRSISGAHLYAASTFGGAGLADCDGGSSKLLWDTTTKRFSCGTDVDTDTDTQFSNTGALRTAFDVRYVNVGGDTMTGALTINLMAGTVGLEVIQAISGSSIFANASLRSSGSLAVTGTGVIQGKLSVGGAVEGHADLISGLALLRVRAAAGGDTLTFSEGNGLSVAEGGVTMRMQPAHGSNTGRFGTYTDSSLSIITNNAVRAVFNQSGALTLSPTTGVREALNVLGTISGSNVYAAASISGSHLYAASTLGGAGLASCNGSTDKLLYNAATKRFECGTDLTGGGSVNTGALAADFNGRYVNIGGDTMTGALVIDVRAGNINTIGLRVINTFSGAIVQATQQLRSSGTLVTESGATFDGGTLHVAAGPNRVGVGTASPLALLHVYDAANAPQVLIQSNAIERKPTLRFDNGAGSGAIQLNDETGFEVYATYVDIFGDATVSGTFRVSDVLRADNSSKRVGIGTMNPGSKLAVSGAVIIGAGLTTQAADAGLALEILGTASGSNLFATKSITGSHLYAASTLGGAGLASCNGSTDKLLYNAATKRFECGTDLTGGGSVNTGALAADFNGRYVNVSGDTMTGALVVNVLNGNAASVGLEVIQTISGSTVFANTSLRSSGSLTWEGAASGSSLWVSTIDGAGLTDCDAAGQTLNWDAATKRFTCGVDDSAGSGLDQNSADARYVRKSGDTMTGSLVIDLLVGTVGLEVAQTISGSSIFVNNSLRSSGSLAVEGSAVIGSSLTVLGTISGSNIYSAGSASGKHLYAASTFGGAGLGSCNGSTDKLLYNTTTKRFECGTDLTGGGSVNTGALAADFNGRYVNVGGDTMTGALAIDVLGGNMNTLGLRVINTFSGAILQATKQLRSSGTLVVESTTRLNSGAYVMGNLLPAADNAYNLGSSSLRWKDLYLSGGTLHIGTSLQEGKIGYRSRGFEGLVFYGSGSSANPSMLISSGGLVGIGITLPRTALEVLGTISGSNVYAAASASGSHLYAASTFAGAGLTDCDAADSKLVWNATTKQFSCGSDVSSGSVNTGALAGNFNGRYVNVSGDTMTGALAIDVLNGTINTLGLRVINTFSGAIVQATKFLRSSGSLVTESGATFDGGTLHIAAGPNRVGIGKTDPKTSLDVIGGISGSYLKLSGDASQTYALSILKGASTAAFQATDGTDTIRLLNGPIAVQLMNGASNTIELLKSGGANFNMMGNDADFSIWGDTVQNLFFLDASADKIGIAKTDPKTILDVLGTVSGSNLYAAGSASGKHLYAASTFGGAGLADCDGDAQTLGWDASTKQFVCGDDDTTGGGGANVDTGALAGDFNGRYVNVGGDTMTGSLVISGPSGNALLHVGGITGETYNAFSDAATATHSSDVSGDNDLFIEGALEVDGAIYAEGVLYVDILDGNVNDYIVVNDPLNIGGITGQSYNLIASAATAGHASNINDLYIEDILEVDGSAYLDGTLYTDSLQSDMNTYIVLNDAFNVGGITGVSYNAISDGGSASHAGSDDDLYIEDILEVDGNAYLEGTLYTDSLQSDMNSYVVLNDSINIGGLTGASYNAISDGGTANFASTDNDLYVEDILEVNGAAHFASSVYVTGTFYTDSLQSDMNTYIVLNDAFNVGGITGASYNAISDSGTASYASTDDDLYIEDILEVGGAVYLNGSLQFTSGSFNGCALETDLSGNLVCGTDDTGGGSGGEWSNTGALATDFNGRYVNIGGDTMTGALVIDVRAGNINTIGLRVINTFSGAIVQATQQLRSSGTLVTESGANIAGALYVSGPSGNVGIGTVLPDRRLEVSEGTNVQLRLSYSPGAYYTDLGTDDVGNLVITPSSGFAYLSGALATESGATFDGGTLHVAAGPNRVGIGTIMPTNMFDITTGETDNSAFHFGETAGKGAYFTSVLDGQFSISTGAEFVADQTVARHTSATVFQNQNGALAFYTDDGLTIGNVFTPTERMRVAPDGKVGIGTSNPEAMLELIGTMSGRSISLGGTGSAVNASLTILGGNVIHRSSGNPTLKATLDTTGDANSIAVAGRYAYLADDTAGLRIIDISDPNAPALVGTYDTTANASGIEVAGRYAYVADFGSGLVIIDISNPAAPKRVGGYDTADESYELAVEGKYAYLADGGSGLVIVDISNPIAPRLAGFYNTTGEADDVAVAGRYAYVADFADGIHVIDVSVPSRPVLMGTYNTAGNAQGIAVSGRYAYVADGTAGLRIVDVSNPASPTPSGVFNTSGNAVSVTVAGRYAYVSDFGGGLVVIDVSNPASPVFIGSYDSPGNALGAAISGKHAFLADGSTGLLTVDINGTETPTLTVGNVDAGTVNITDGLTVLDINVRGGMQVGQAGIRSDGPLAIMTGSGGVGSTGALIRSRGNTGALLALDANTKTEKTPHLSFGYQGAFDVDVYRHASGGLTIDNERGDTAYDVLRIVTNYNSANNTIFRVAGDGNAFTEGAFTGGGADYAEYFYSSTKDLTQGELVCIDVTRESTVKRCDRAADGNLIGIVSHPSQAAFIGNKFKALDGLPVPGTVLVGLIGQVKTRVMVESGAAIRPGDALTSAGKPGFARKARAGESTVGVALQPLAAGEGVIDVLISRRNQSLTVEAVEEKVLKTVADLEIGDEVQLMVAQAMDGLDLGIEVKNRVAEEIGAMDLDSRIARIVGEELARRGDQDGIHAAAPSDEVLLSLVDRIAALEVKLAASGGTLSELLAAGSITAEDTLSAGGDARIGGDLYLEGALVTDDLFIPGSMGIDGLLSVKGDLEVAGTLTLLSGASLSMQDLVVDKALYVMGDVTIEGLALFLGDTEIRGELRVNPRQAGHATVPAGARSVTVRFQTGFTAVPVVTASSEDFVLSPWRIKPVTQTGFTIELRDPAEEAVTFAWHALVPAGEGGSTEEAEAVSLTPFPVDALGYPVSQNEIWNGCIRNRVTLDESGQPYSCARYHVDNAWTHPELGITFTFNASLTPPYLLLPEGYETEAVVSSSSSSSGVSAAESLSSDAGSSVSSAEAASSLSASVGSSSASSVSAAAQSADGAVSSAESLASSEDASVAVSSQGSSVQEPEPPVAAPEAQPAPELGGDGSGGVNPWNPAE